MATYTVAAGGGNINAGATYVGGVAPNLTNTSADTIVFTATSGQLTVNAAVFILGFDLTNYTNTITFTNSITINTGGSINFGSGGYTQAGASGFICAASSTITTGGVTWSRTLNLGAATGTCTLVGNLTTTGLLTLNSSTGVVTISGAYTITASGGVTTSSTGTTSPAASPNAPSLVVSGGTVTWTAAVQLNTTIKPNASTTVTFANQSHGYNTGTLTLDTSNAGSSIAWGTSTLSCSFNTTFKSNGVTWGNVTLTGNGQTFTFLDNFNCGGTWTLSSTVTSTLTLSGSVTYTTVNLTLSGVAGLDTIALANDITVTNTLTGNGKIYSGAYKIYVKTITNTSVYTYTATTIVMTGGGILNNSTVGNLTIAGDLTITNTITLSTFNYAYTSCGITYSSGAVTTTGSTLTNANVCTLDTYGMEWYNIVMAAVPTLTSGLRVKNNLSWNVSTTPLTFNTNIIVGGLFINPTASLTINLNPANQFRFGGIATNTTSTTAGVFTPTTIASTIANQPARLTITNPNSITPNINLTDIDCSFGYPLYYQNGAITRCNNVLQVPNLASPTQTRCFMITNGRV